MSGRHRLNKARRTRDVDRFTNFPNYVLASEAVRTLRPSAFMVLVYLAMRCFGAKGNGRIVFANRSGCRWFDPETRKWVEMPIGGPREKPMAKSTIGDGLRELERRGLIVCTQRSTFDQKRLAKTYRLTWVRTEDQLATNDFLKWRPENSKPRPPHRPMGYATGRPTGRSPQPTSSEQAIQAAPPACQQRHRPPHRPRNYHVLGDGDE
ncbi:MAG: hypothetical protein ACREFW_04575 [Rhizomicrobium sp.]